MSVSKGHVHSDNEEPVRLGGCAYCANPNIGPAKCPLHSPDRTGNVLDGSGPAPYTSGAWLSRDLLLRAVDLRAVAWNALCALPVDGHGDWGRFYRKLHELREAVNRPEHEDIRLAYARSFPDPGRAAERDTSPCILDEHWRIVDAARLAEPEGEHRGR